MAMFKLGLIAMHLLLDNSVEAASFCKSFMCCCVADNESGTEDESTREDESKSSELLSDPSGSTGETHDVSNIDDQSECPFGEQVGVPQNIDEDFNRLKQKILEGQLLHPLREYNSKTGDFESDPAKKSDFMSFADMAYGLATACGLAPEDNIHKVEQRDLPEHNRNLRTLDQAEDFAKTIGHNEKCDSDIKHIIFILCDGMGSNVINKHLSEDSFLRQNNNENKMRSIFPATTPAALTTLATGVWPGQHGSPGWDLRDQTKCELNETKVDPVQTRVLAGKVMDMRSKKPMMEIEHGYKSNKEIFIKDAWAAGKNSKRLLTYINAYNGSQFTDFYQNIDGCTKPEMLEDICWEEEEEVCKNCLDEHKEQSDEECCEGVKLFGQKLCGTNSGCNKKPGEKCWHAKCKNKAGNNVELGKINEIAMDTVGFETKPETPQDAIKGMANMVDMALARIKKADEFDRKTYTYIYTAHPDKLEHKLGTEHENVKKVLNGLNTEIERLWTGVEEIVADGKKTMKNENGVTPATGASLFITADHGHVSVEAKNRVVMPQELLDEYLEYACVGVHGKGRHALFRAKPGMNEDFEKTWYENKELSENFVLIPTSRAEKFGLFGPERKCHSKTRRRLSDYIAIALNYKTICAQSEADALGDKTQGGHGSIYREEIMIPYILKKTE